MSSFCQGAHGPPLGARSYVRGRTSAAALAEDFTWHYLRASILLVMDMPAPQKLIGELSSVLFQACSVPSRCLCLAAAGRGGLWHLTRNLRCPVGLGELAQFREVGTALFLARGIPWAKGIL